MTGKSTWCSHGSHRAPPEEMVLVPAGPIKRWICKACLARRKQRQGKK